MASKIPSEALLLFIAFNLKSYSQCLLYESSALADFLFKFVFTVFFSSSVSDYPLISMDSICTVSVIGSYSMSLSK